MGRWAFWGLSDVEDYKKFPKRDIQRSSDVYHYQKHKNVKLFHAIVFDNLKIGQDSFDKFLEERETTSFIVIKDNKIVFEKYYNGYHRESINTSFSMAKVITSILVGIAIDEGKINGVHDLVTDYLPEMKSNIEYPITIRHLLTMSSGLELNENHIFFWQDGPLIYYHPQIKKRALERKSRIKPGEVWEYNGYNSQLLGIILERATGKTISKYAEEKLWIPMGAEFKASWSLGGAEEGFEKMESGFNARSIDFAKIGSIFLNSGMWNGKQIVSSKWVSESTSPSFFNIRAWGDNRYFGYKWWGILDGNQKVYYAPGHLGQYIYVNPAERIVIVRNGKGYGDLYRHQWITLMNLLVDELK